MSSRPASNLPQRSLRTPLATSSSANTLARGPRSESSRNGIKGTIVYDDNSSGSKGATSVKDDLYKSGSKASGKEEQLEKRLKALEKRVECNAQVHRDKNTTLDDRLTRLQAHVLGHFTQQQSYTSTSGSTTPDKFNTVATGNVTQSPPVPALRKRMDDAAAEWERSMMDAEVNLTEIDSRDTGLAQGIDEEDEEMEDLRDQISKQQKQIDTLVQNSTDHTNQRETQKQQIETLIEQNAQQAEQIAFLIGHLQECQGCIASAQFDLDVERGRVADLEGRLEQLEEACDLRDTSIMIDTCPPSSPENSQDQHRTERSGKRRAIEPLDHEESSNKRFTL